MVHILERCFGTNALALGVDVSFDTKIGELTKLNGTNALALGVDVSFDTKIGELTKLNGGFDFTKDDLGVIGNGLKGVGIPSVGSGTSFVARGEYYCCSWGGNGIAGQGGRGPRLGRCNLTTASWGCG
ncbi:unnamed protein product [Lupinus luteus]|uniref:Uncharacterized protein n=1 Tax=Lupinus luteus TaxID=3873 RepID=A0AAV1WZX3_LUPLU